MTMLIDIAYNLLTVFGIGLVIFVHELGHFMAARSVGVRVEAFSIGFGPRLFGFRRGDTDWKVCLIPLGGFVKMAGEQIATSDSQNSAAKPDEFLAKSFLQKTWIISAGVIMNVLFAAVAFPLAFSIGVPFEPPMVGALRTGGPAWTAGLLPGDRITHVDGTHILAFEDLATAIAVGDDHRELTVARKDSDPIKITVDIGSARTGGLRSLGVFPTYKNPIVASSVAGASDSDSERARVHRESHGIKPGDQIVEIDGLSISEAIVMDDVAAQRPRLLTIIRDETRLSIELPQLPIELPGSKDRRLGLDPSATKVVSVRSDSPFAKLGLISGDVIMAINDRRVVTESEVANAMAPLSRPRTMTVRRNAESKVIELSSAAPESLLRVFLQDVVRGADGVVISPRTGGPAASVGIEPGDRILRIDDEPVMRFSDIETFASKDSVSLTVFREGHPEKTVLVSRGQVAPEPVGGALLGLEQTPVLENVKASLGSAIPLGFAYLRSTTDRIVLTLRRLVDRSVPASNLGGIITIFKKSAMSSKIAPSRGILFLAVISVNLAILNILPIPVLDGGWLLILIIERLRRGKPIPEKVLAAMQWSGLIIVLGLMVFVTWNDIQRWFLG